MKSLSNIIVTGLAVYALGTGIADAGDCAKINGYPLNVGQPVMKREGSYRTLHRGKLDFKLLTEEKLLDLTIRSRGYSKLEKAFAILEEGNNITVYACDGKVYTIDYLGERIDFRRDPINENDTTPGRAGTKLPK